MQTRKQSLFEVSTNTSVGLVINWVIVYVCMKLSSSPEAAASASVMLCTINSLVRGYALRRWFAGREVPR